MLQCRILHYVKSAPPKSADLNTAIVEFSVNLGSKQAHHTTPRVAWRVVSCLLLVGRASPDLPGPGSPGLHAALCCAWQRQTAGRTCQVSLPDRQVRSQVATDLTDAVTVRTCRLLLQKIPCSLYSLRPRKSIVLGFCLTVCLIQKFCTNYKINKSLLKYP
jgi:hypothetical protein